MKISARADRVRARRKSRSSDETTKAPSRALFPQARYLTRKERVALDAYRDYLLRKLPGEVERIVLFGSKARGDGTEDSDVDLLVVVDRADEPTTVSLEDDPGFDLLMQYGALISSHFVGADQTKRWTPLLAHVWQDGIELWRRRGAKTWQKGVEQVMPMSKDEHIEARMAIARDKVVIARELCEKGHYNDTISKAYYAMFYASKALLLALGEDPHKHAGVVNLFGDRIARVGYSDPRYGHTLGSYKELREKADYSDEFHATQEGAEKAIREAEDFVNEAGNILERIRQRAQAGQSPAPHPPKK